MGIFITALVLSVLWFVNCIFAILTAFAMNEYNDLTKKNIIKAAVPFYNIYLVYKYY